MTERQKAYQAAQQRGMTITENRENRGITIRVEAPAGFNYGSDHEVVTHWHSGTDWPDICKTIADLMLYPCEADCEWWTA